MTITALLIVEREITPYDVDWPDGSVTSVEGHATVEIELPAEIEWEDPVPCEDVAKWCAYTDRPLRIVLVERNPAYQGPDALLPDLVPPETLTRTIEVKQ